MSLPQDFIATALPDPRGAITIDIPRVDSLEAFGLQVARQLSRCRRQGGQLTVIWIDAALQLRARQAASTESARQALAQALSRRLRNRVRGSDEVTQVGEESFAVVLPLTGQPEAALVEERLQQALKGSYEVDGQLMHASLSLGSATFPDVGQSGRDLAEQARQNCLAAGAAAPLPQTSSHSLRM